ncbi:MAG: rod shape-determining protein RodA [Bacteroidales bacterium]
MSLKNNSILARLDWGVVFIWLALMCVGLISIYAVGYTAKEGSAIFNFSSRTTLQILWVGIAFVIATLVMVVESRFFSAFSVFLYIIGLFLIIVTLIFGREINGSKSWLSLGIISIQPIEFVKVATALFLAKRISGPGFKIQNSRDFLHIVLIIALPFAFTLLQHDTGSALVLSSFIIVFYRAGLRAWIVSVLFFLVSLFALSLLIEQHSIVILMDILCIGAFMIMSRKYKLGFIVSILIAIATIILHILLPEVLDIEIPLFEALLIVHAILIPIVLFYALFRKFAYLFVVIGLFITSVAISYSVDYIVDNVLKEHQRRRINDLLGIESDLKGWGYNVHQSKIAIGSGGFAGKGFLEGTQTKGNFVPEQATDFIFCAIGEEWGFLGSCVVIGLYLMLLIRLTRIAERQKNTFAKIYGYGVVSILFFHFFVNIGMTIGVMPVIGIPLPFISYGGSSLWAFTILVFILLNLDVARYRLQN